MKSIMLSIAGRHVSNIERGLKTYELRKNKPLCELPFKCYMYETLNSNGRGAVVGEFVCDKIDKLLVGDMLSSDFRQRLNADSLIKGLCINRWNITDYLYGKHGYCWHISQLKIYDSPKELSELRNLGTLKRPPQSWCYCVRLEDE